MKVVFLPPFLADLMNFAEPHFARRVLRKCVTEDGEFKHDQDDHRFHGLEDAWIRYVSRGNTAYRVIYLRRGGEVHFYRAGGHSIEDGLHATDLHTGVVLGQATMAYQASASPTASRLKFLYANRNKRLIQAFRERRLIPHKEVTVVSPFVSATFLSPTGKFGRLLFDLIEDSTDVTLITLPPASEDTFAYYQDLEAKGLKVLFYPRLHSKLYMFVGDRQRQRYERPVTDLFVLGSSNLTEVGTGAEETGANEELCCELPEEATEFLEGYVVRLVSEAFDVTKMRIELTKRGKRWH